MNDKLGIYVHIPFCIKKCLYCDFCSVSNSTLHNKYVAALIEEIEKNPVKADTVFIGGGTPTVLKNRLLDVIEAITETSDLSSDCEFTVEANPGTADYQLLSDMKKLGVNRLSLGAQSFNDNELALLGRIHSSKEIFEAADMARRAGFDNISLDIMLSTPSQSIESIKHTLSSLKSIAPEHISAYSLIIEENTPFYSMDLSLPNEDEEREIYYYTEDYLRNMGLMQYEISNFALPERESRHNIKYWTLQPYIGFGAAAHSNIGNLRFYNTCDIDEYILGKGRHIDEEVLSAKERLKEKFMLGLRMLKGVEYHGEFASSVSKLTKQGLIENADGRIRLTKKGLDLGNLVFMEFI